MKTIRFATEADARELSAAVDKAAGYPKHGVDVGGGKHVDPQVSRTLYASYVAFDSEAAASAKYAYIVTDEVEAQAGKTQTVDGKQVAIDVDAAADDYDAPTAKPPALL